MFTLKFPNIFFTYIVIFHFTLCYLSSGYSFSLQLFLFSFLHFPKIVNISVLFHFECKKCRITQLKGILGWALATFFSLISSSVFISLTNVTIYLRSLVYTFYCTTAAGVIWACLLQPIYSRYTVWELSHPSVHAHTPPPALPPPPLPDNNVYYDENKNHDVLLSHYQSPMLSASLMGKPPPLPQSPLNSDVIREQFFGYV